MMDEDEREWRRERLGLAPDSAKAMEREGVGRVVLANLCFSDQDRSSVAVRISTPAD